MAVPADTPVTIAEVVVLAATVAVAVLAELHVRPAVVQLSVVVAVSHIEAVPVIPVAGIALTVNTFVVRQPVDSV